MTIKEFIEMCPAITRQDIGCELSKWHFKKDKKFSFEYINWKGEFGIRKVKAINLFIGSTEYHTEEQWLLKAYDCDKNAERDFAINDILKFI